MADLKLTFLGGFELRLVSGEMVDLPAQKDRALLAILALTSGNAHSRDRLAGLLWSERGDHQARGSLKQSLMRLRRCLNGTGDDVLKADRRSAALYLDAISVDVLNFSRQVREGTIDSLKHAIELYRGDLLDGISIHDREFEDWLLVERQRLRQLFEHALANLMAKLLAVGDPGGAGDAARKLLSLDPVNEAAHRTLMQVHCDQGQSAQALKLYDVFRERIHRELGIHPDPATIALVEDIRRRGSKTISSPLDQVALPDPPEFSLSATKPSIAVLPFLNLGDDPGQQYFSDGITQDIITELSRFRTLFVVGRDSSFRYRAGVRDVAQAAKDLGVRYLAEGSVRRVGERVRISSQLIDTATGAHLWAENYDRDAVDVLAVQDEIIKAIATTLGYQVEAAGRERALRLNPDTLSAYDHVLRSEALMLHLVKSDNAEARRWAEAAVEQDPKSAQAHAQLGWTHCIDYICGWVQDPSSSLDTAFMLAQRAVLLDEADCRARWLLGNLHIYRREFDEARAHLLRAIELNPNDVDARGMYGFYLIATGEPEAALEQLDIAKRQSPFDFNYINWYRGIALFTARRYEKAIATLKQVPNPNNEVRCWLAASYAAAGHLAEARAMLSEFLTAAERERECFPGRTLEQWKPSLHAAIEYRDQADFDHLFDALRAAGLD